MRTFILFPALLVASTASAYLGACNGNIKLCDRSYSNISHIGTHNSPFDAPANLASNQEKSIDEQLNAGIRFLQAQTHYQLGILQMCHTNCLLYDRGSLYHYLQQVNKWINGPANQQQVVTLLLTNQDAADVSKFDDVFKDFGLDKIAYVPPQQLALDDWPTLQELIDSGKRLIVFMDYHSDQTKVPYILDQFAYYFETPYDWTDSSFNQCSVDRPPGANPDGRMYLVNHYLDKKILGDILISDYAQASDVNKAEDIEKQVSLCQGLYGRNPNVVLVDWFDRGDVFTAQNQMNNL